jgi:hypothetical protein
MSSIGKPAPAPAYVTQGWVDHVTPVDAAHMNHLEAGVAAANRPTIGPEAAAICNDPDAITETGWYYWDDGFTVNPPPSRWGYLHAYVWPGVFGVRLLAFDFNTSRVWTRYQGGQWIELATSATVAELEARLATLEARLA